MDKVIIRKQYARDEELVNCCVVRNGRMHWASDRRAWQMEIAAARAGYTSQSETKIVNKGTALITIATWTK